MRSFFLLFTAFLVIGCTKMQDSNPESILKLSQSRYLSMDEIQALALNLPLRFGETTRSGAMKVIKEVRPLADFISRNITKTDAGRDNGDSVLENVYVVNYEENGGFAIIAADSVMENILAYSDDGNITDTMTNPGVRVFMNMIPSYVTQQLAASDSMIDPEDQYPAQTKIIIGNETTTPVGPLVPVRWGQYAPFNDEVQTPWISCDIPAGCVAIAILQIMAAHQYPSTFWVLNGRYTCNWNLWKTYFTGSYFNEGSYDRRAIAALVKEIGSEVDMSYGCNGSEASVGNADYGLRVFGFLTDGVYSYHIDRVMSDLYNRRPIYLRGYATNNWIGYSDGHAWLVDGYKDVYYLYDVYNNYYDDQYNLIRQEYVGRERGERSTRWLHCNYGWHGAGNGYYYVGVFNTASCLELDANCGIADQGHYQYKLQVIRNIRKP